MLVFLPVWVSGGAEKLLDYGFINKGTYIRLGSISYLDGIKQLAAPLGNMWSLSNLKKIYRLAPFLLPFLTFGALLAAWLRTGTDKRSLTITVFLFVGVAFLGVFPRASIIHLSYVIPELLIGLAYVWRLTKPYLTTQWDPQVFYPSLQPVILERYVKEHMERRRDFGRFILYRLAAAPIVWTFG